jgi:hypothetical protein
MPGNSLSAAMGILKVDELALNERRFRNIFRVHEDHAPSAVDATIPIVEAVKRNLRTFVASSVTYQFCRLIAAAVELRNSIKSPVAAAVFVSASLIRISPSSGASPASAAPGEPCSKSLGRHEAARLSFVAGAAGVFAMVLVLAGAIVITRRRGGTPLGA